MGTGTESVLRRVVGLLAIVIAIVVYPNVAHATDVIQDRGELTVDLTSANACFIRPANLRRAEPCTGFTPEAVDVPSKIDGQDMIVLALLHLPSGVAGQVLVMRQVSELTYVDRGTAERYVEGFGKGAAKSVSTTATARTSNIRIVPSGNASFVRASIDITDTKTGVIVPAFAHQELLLIHTKGATYIVASLGPDAETEALKKIVDDIMATAVVTHPITVSESRDVSYLIGQVMAYAIIAGVLIVAAIYSHRRSKRQQAEWQAWQAQQQQYQPHQYPPYHPQYQQPHQPPPPPNPGGSWRPPGQ